MNHFILHNLSNPLLIIIYQTSQREIKASFSHTNEKCIFYRTLDSPLRRERKKFIRKGVNNFSKKKKKKI